MKRPLHSPTPPPTPKSKIPAQTADPEAFKMEHLNLTQGHNLMTSPTKTINMYMTPVQSPIQNTTAPGAPQKKKPPGYSVLWRTLVNKQISKNAALVRTLEHGCRKKG